MRIPLTILRHTTLVLVYLLATIPGAFAQHDLTVLPESQLWIDGTSSLHDWTCDVSGVEGTLLSTALSDTLPETLEQLTETTLAIPVSAIECFKRVMNKKTQDALDARNHPQITYTLTQSEVVRPTADAAIVLQTKGDLTIAGTTRPINTIVYGTPQPGDIIQLWGAFDLKMSDFGIKPPTAMLGTLKTGDTVTIRFELAVASSSR